MSLIPITVLTLLAATGFPPIAAPAALVLLCWCPGRIIMGAGSIGRAWDRPGKTILAVALSVVFMPVFLYPLWHLGNHRPLLLGAVWGILAAGALAVRVFRPADPSTVPGWVPSLRLCERQATAVMLLLIALVAALATIGPYWPTHLRGYPVPASIHDFIKHYAVLYSLQERPLPLGNPFYAAEAGGPVYYYCLFYLIPATVRAVAGGPGIQLAFGIQSLLVALSTIGLFYLIVKRFIGGDGPAVLAALLSSIIGGLDVVAVLVLGKRVVTLDAWADPVNRIHNLLNQMMWSPQNVLGLLTVLVIVYVLSEKGLWRGWFILGPAAGVAAWGSSPWVAVVLFAAVGAWWLYQCVAGAGQPNSRQRLLGAGVVGALSFAAAIPILRGYMEMSARHGKGLTVHWPYSSNAWLGKLVPPGPAANLLDLPWILVIEFGALLLFPLILVPRSVWRRAWADDGIRLLMIAVPIALAGFVTVRSHFMYNDFGQKSLMVAMAAGVVLAAGAVRSDAGPSGVLNPFGWRVQAGSTPSLKRLAGLVLFLVLMLGLPVGVSEIPLTAVRRFLPDRGWASRLVPDSSRRASREGPAWTWMRNNLPASAVLQADPGEERVQFAQVAERQMGMTELDADAMVFYPVGREAHARRLANLEHVLYQPTSPEALYGAFRDCRVTHVFIGTVERERWKCLELFEDRARYEPIFEDAAGVVYRLR